MCTQATLDKINDVVTDFVNDGRLFSAFEVSLEVQKRQTAVGESPERHRHMKREIHGSLQQYLSTSLYDCVNQKVGDDDGKALYALLYYPAGADPNSYLPLDRKDSTKPTSPAQPATATSPALPTTATSPALPATASVPSLSLTSNGNGGDNKDSGRKTDARGVICVPNYLLRAAGFQHKDIAYVVASQENGKDVIRLTKRATTTPLAQYTVDSYSNVRITRATLDAAGIGQDGATYDFEGTSANEVIVRIHQ